MFHDFVVKLTFGFDPFVMIEIVDSYAKCINLMDAHKLFDEIPIKSPIACNAMVQFECVQRRSYKYFGRICFLLRTSFFATP